MGQKVNPHGLRVGVIKDWDSRWYARNDKVGDLLVEDYNIRKDLKKRLYSAGIAKIEIERSNARVKINLHCSRPGVVIGKGGPEIEKLRLELEQKLGKAVSLNIVEIRSPDLNAQLVAENIAAQLEKRISFRRAMKKAMQQCDPSGRQGHQGAPAAAVWAAPKSPAASPIMRAPSPCRLCARTSTTASLRPTPPTARSAQGLDLQGRSPELHAPSDRSRGSAP